VVVGVVFEGEGGGWGGGVGVGGGGGGGGGGVKPITHLRLLLKFRRSGAACITPFPPHANLVYYRGTTLTSTCECV